MNVRMPDGTIITNVPDNITQTDLLARYNRMSAMQKPEEPSGFLRQVADVPLGVAKGVASGIQMLSDIFGAGNPVSQALQSTQSYLNDLMSAQARNDQKEIARIMKEAEDKGIADQVIAGIKAFATAPVDMLSQAAGTAIPVIAGGLAGTVAKIAAPRVVGGGIGAGMGTGVVKGTIYEETKQALKDAGVSDDQAEARAQLAQSYGGKNLDQILMGTALGGLTAVVGIEKPIALALSKRILGKEAAEKAAEETAKEAGKSATRRILGTAGAEAAPEFLQAAQEQIAANVAQQREGLDVDLLRSAVSAGTLEALSGAGLGAGVGAVSGRPVAKTKTTEETTKTETRESITKTYNTVNRRGQSITVDVTTSPDGTVTAKTSDNQDADFTSAVGAGKSVEELINTTFSRKNAKPATLVEEKEEQVTPDKTIVEDKEKVQEKDEQVTPDKTTEKVQPTGVSNLTADAEALLASVDAGGTPAFMTNNLRRIAKENGIDTTGKTPDGVIAELRAKKAAGIKPEDAKVETDAPPKLETPEGFKLKEGRNEQVVLAARQLEEKLAAAKNEEEKNAAKAEYDRYVNYYTPIPVIKSDAVESPLSTDELNKVLTLPKVGKDQAKIDAPVEDGTAVGLRMDIPALKEGKKQGLRGSVVSIHKASDPDKKSAGTNLSYKSAGHITDPVMAIRSEEQAFDVAKSEEGRAGQKKPQQTIEGKWVNTPPEEIFTRVQELMNDPSWTQVSLDPNRHSFFYDRKTNRPVISGSEAYQVGRFVLVKDAKFGNRNSFLYAQAKPNTKGNPRSAVEALINKVKEGWVNAPPVQVVQSINDLPADLQRQIEEDGVNPKGAYHPPTGIVYIIADNIAGYRDAFVTLAHESLGHFGLRSILGDRYNAVMDNLYNTNSEVKKLADKKIKEGLDRATAVEEVLAEAIEDRIPQDTMLGRAVQVIKNLIRQFANKLGVKNLSDAEVQQLLDAARDYVIEGRSKAAPGRVEGRAVFAKAKKPAGKRSTGGEAAMQTVQDIGREPPVTATLSEKILDVFKNPSANPSLSKEAIKKSTTNFVDYVETKLFTTDAALNNSIRRIITDSTMSDQEKMGALLSISSNQAVHADALASLFIQQGNLTYDPKLYKYQGVQDKNNFVEFAKAVDLISKNHGLTNQEASRVVHTYFEARRLDGVMRFNETVDAEVFAAIDRIDKAIDDGDENAEKVAEQDKRKAQQKYKYVHMTRDEIDAGLKLVDNIPELSQAADIWNGIRQNAARRLVDDGLWTEEEADRLLAVVEYVPFFREDQIEKGKGPKEFLRGLEVQAKEKKFKGSDLPVADITDNMVRWTQYAIKRSVMNRLGQAKVQAAVQFGLARPVEESKKGPNSVRVWENGEAAYYDMDDPLYMEAFAGLESVALPIWKVFAAMSNFLRQSVVLYPLFSVSQVPQDAFAAIFSSGLKTRYALSIPARAVKEYIQTLRGSSKAHAVLKQFGAVGIKDFSSAIAREDSEVAAGLKKTPGIWNKVKGMLEHISMASDNAIRQAVYTASIDQGLTQAEAIEKAFTIINFRNRGGSPTIRMLGQVVPFFNAYLAAQHVAIKTISGVGISPSSRAEALKTLGVTTATIMGLSFLYAMAMDDEDDYINKPSVMRDRLFIIPGTGMTIPIRTDIFSMPKILTEHMYMLMTDQGMADSRKFRDSMKSAMGNILFGPTPVPQAIKPLVEVGVNYNFFQGRPLTGTFQKGLDIERQFNDSTSELAKLFGQTRLVSPIAADHLFRGMLGSLGGLIVFVTNPILHSDPAVPRPELSFTEAMAALPGTSGLISRPFETGLKNDFYVLRDEVSRAANTFNDIKRRSPADIEEFLAKEDNVTRVGLQKAVNQITENLSNIRKRISVITNLPASEMSASEKRSEINDLKQIEQEMLRNIDIKELRRMANL